MTRHPSTAPAPLARATCAARTPDLGAVMPTLDLSWIERFDGVQHRYEPVVGSRP
jgi:hypothetical protein